MPERLLEALQNGFISMIGGIANYFYVTEKTKSRFKFLSFFTNCLLAYFVGVVVGDFIPMEEQTYGVLMVAGFCCYPIVGYFEKRVIKLLDKYYPPISGSSNPSNDSSENKDS